MNTIPTVTKNLLIINVLMFLGTIVAQSYGIDLNNYLGLHFFLAGDFNAAQLITYMFMHGGFTHLFFNMFAVWMFGRILEQVWGPKRFLFYYLACGIGAGLIQELVQYIHYETVLSAYDSVNTGYSIIPMEEYRTEEMATIITDLKESFRRGNIYIQLIYINVGVFIFTTLTGVILQLFNRSLGGVFEWLELPASLPRFIIQPWAVLTYMFMHAGVLHILFNMLWLYWFGALFLNFFSARHLRGVYILGGICGGLLYMTAYNIFPYFRPMTEYSFMLGASASVLAIVAATAYREPDYPIRLFLFGTVRLKYLALVVIVTDLLFITSSNAGGHIAHLGGALAGLWFAASLSKGADITAWINKSLDAVTALFSFKPRKPKMKVHYGTERQKDYNYNARKKAQSDEIDRILDKLKKSGYESLTTEEKKSLFDASKR